MAKVQHEVTLQDLFTNIEQALATVKQTERVVDDAKHKQRAVMKATAAARQRVVDAAAITLRAAQAANERAVGTAEQQRQLDMKAANERVAKAEAAYQAACDAAQPMLAELQARTDGILPGRQSR